MVATGICITECEQIWQQGCFVHMASKFVCENKWCQARLSKAKPSQAKPNKHMYYLMPLPIHITRCHCLLPLPIAVAYCLSCYVICPSHVVITCCHCLLPLPTIIFDAYCQCLLPLQANMSVAICLAQVHQVTLRWPNEPRHAEEAQCAHRH